MVNTQMNQGTNLYMRKDEDKSTMVYVCNTVTRKELTSLKISHRVCFGMVRLQPTLIPLVSGF